MNSSPQYNENMFVTGAFYPYSFNNYYHNLVTSYQILTKDLRLDINNLKDRIMRKDAYIKKLHKDIEFLKSRLNEDNIDEEFHRHAEERNSKNGVECSKEVIPIRKYKNQFAMTKNYVSKQEMNEISTIPEENEYF